MSTDGTLWSAQRPAAAQTGPRAHDSTRTPCTDRTDDLTACRASLLADETATLTLVVTGLRALRPELARAAGIDALGTPASYRLLLALLDDLLGDAAGLLDTRQWADVDERRVA